jgi:hypothetical protein
VHANNINHFPSVVMRIKQLIKYLFTYAMAKNLPRETLNPHLLLQIMESLFGMSEEVKNQIN